MMADICKAANLEPLVFHELRHTYASGLVNRGVSLVFVAQQLGHRNTTMVEMHSGDALRRGQHIHVFQDL